MIEEIPTTKLIEVCERAAQYRRLVARGKAPAFVLEQDIIAVPVAPPITVHPNGWAKVGTVSDGIEGQCLDIWWQPDQDKVRVQRPKVFAPPTPPRTVGDPLYRTDRVATACEKRPFTAQPGFVYCFDGMEYIPEETEALTARLGSIKGWTWKPL